MISMGNRKKFKKHVNFKISILISMILLTLVIISISLNKDITLLVEALIVGIFFIWYIYINDKRLLIFTILATLLTPTLLMLNGFLSNIPYFLTILLSIKLFEKKIMLKEKIRFNKIIVLLTITLLITNIFSFIYNHYDINITLILFYSLKKFSFLVFYLFFTNINVSKKDIKNSLNIFIIFAIIQFLIAAIQFVGGVRQDDLGAMFGENSTGIMIQFLSIILILITAFGDEFSKIPFLDLIFMMLSLIYSALGEVKIGFIIIPFVYLFTLLLKGKKSKIIITMFVLFLSFGAIYTFYIGIYPNQNTLSTITHSKKYLQNAYGSDAINRSGFLPLLKSTVIDNTEKQLFGAGLATLNPSKLDILQGPLIKEYGYLNIHFFALPYSIAENGIVGTFIWIMIYIYILVVNIKEYISNKNNKSIVNIILIIDTFIFMTYNNSVFSSFIVLILWFIISYFNNEDMNFNNYF